MSIMENENIHLHIINAHDVATVEENVTTGQRLLRAAKAFRKGEVITLFAAEEIFFSPNYLTVQKSDGEHISLSPSFLQYVNHSCAPTCFFDTTSMKFLALEDIAEGDELTFFYPSTEWEMAQPFQCYCANSNCLGVIQGAAFLPEEILLQYRLTEFISQKLRQQKEERA